MPRFLAQSLRPSVAPVRRGRRERGSNLDQRSRALERGLDLTPPRTHLYAARLHIVLKRGGIWMKSMKFLLAAAAASTLFVAGDRVVRADGYGPAGCGLGAMLI